MAVEQTSSMRKVILVLSYFAVVLIGLFFVYVLIQGILRIRIQRSLAKNDSSKSNVYLTAAPLELDQVPTENSSHSPLRDISFDKPNIVSSPELGKKEELRFKKKHLNSRGSRSDDVKIQSAFTSFVNKDFNESQRGNLYKLKVTQIEKETSRNSQHAHIT